MKYADLPVSVEITKSADRHEIMSALGEIVGEAFFSHVDVIRDAPRSGRLLLLSPTKESVSLQSEISRFKMANELLKLLPESRFDPPLPPHKRFVKGWEIHKITVEGKVAVLAWTVWIPHLKLVASN